jgi:hypothetical protein
LVYTFDPPGWALIPIVAGEFDGHLSPVLNISIRQGGEGLLHDQGCSRHSSHLSFGCSLLFKQKALHVVEIALPFHGENQAIDELMQELGVETFVHSDNVLHRPRG